MRNALRRRHRHLALVALVGLLAVAPLVPGPAAWARPYTLDPGTDPNSGDPTGDDQPNPTPKPKNLAPTFAVRNGRAVATEKGSVVRVTGSWLWFVRYLDVFPLR